MQVMLAALGSHGDVLPFIALAVKLKARGHDVTLAAPSPFGTMARRHDVAFHALGTDDQYAAAIGEKDLWHPRRGATALLRHIGGMTQPVYDWVTANRTRNGVVVASQACFGARIAQDKAGFPLVTVHLSPFLIESLHASPVLPGLPLPRFLPSRLRHWIGRGADAYVIGPAVLPGLNALRAGLGLPPVRRLRHWWNSPTCMLLMFPEWFAPRQEDWPPQALQVGFPSADLHGDTDRLSTELAAFLDAGDPPLAFTYGSGMRQGRAFFETAIAVCRRMNRRGVLVATQDGQVPASLPPSILHVPYAPFGLLLPRCAALIHHGGVGTLAQALAAGIPQLVVPIAFDHFDEGARLERLGLGMVLSRRRFRVKRAERVLNQLITRPLVASNCRAVRTLFGPSDGLDAACIEIEHVMANA